MIPINDEKHYSTPDPWVCPMCEIEWASELEGKWYCDRCGATCCDECAQDTRAFGLLCPECYDEKVRP